MGRFYSFRGFESFLAFNRKTPVLTNIASGSESFKVKSRMTPKGYLERGRATSIFGLEH
jgi:hypothetical protein